ncbi:O-antigen ligase family protein [Micromonospora aurantiaca (nom. illeg.)]
MTSATRAARTFTLRTAGMLLGESAPARQSAAGARPAAGGSLLAAVAGTVGSRIVVLLISLAIGVLTARLLGAQDRGAVAVAVAGGSIFSAVCTVGLETANLRYAGISAAAFQQVVRHGIRHVLVLGTAVTALWALLGAVSPLARFGLDPVTFALTLLLGPVVLLSSLLGTAEIARGSSRSYNLTLVGSLVGYGAILGLLTLRGDVTPAAVVVAYLIGQLGGVAVLLVRARPFHRAAGDPIDRAQFRAFARRAYLPNLAQFAMGRSQVPVIQLLAGSGTVGVYAVALPIAETLLILPVALSFLLMPAVATGGADWRRVARMGGCTLLISAVVAVALAAGAPVAIPLLFGAEFEAAVPVLWALLPGLTVLALGRTVQTYLSAIDRPGALTLAAVTGSLAGLVVLVLLTPRLGAVAAGLAVSGSYLVYTVVVGVAFLRVRSAPATVPGAVVPPQTGGTVRGGRWGGPPRSGNPWPRLPGGPTLGVAVLAVAGGVGVGVLAGQERAVLAGCAAAVLMLASVAVPTFGLYLLALAVPASQLPMSARPGEVTLLGILACCLAGVLVTRPRSLRFGRGTVLIVALLAVLSIGAVRNGGPLLSLAALALALAGAALVPAGRHARRITLVFAAAAAVTGLAHTALALAGIDPSTADDPELAEVLGQLNHNVWGPMLVVALAVALANVCSGHRWALRVGSWLAVAALLAGIGFSYSRSSYVGALAVLLCFAARRFSARVFAALVGLTAAGWLAGNRLIPESIAARVAQTTENGLDGSSAVRVDLWLSALRMVLDHPVAGVGFMGFRERLPAYFTPSVTGRGANVGLDLLIHPHNTYLTVLAEAGFVGAVLAVALFVVLVRSIRRRLRVGRDPVAESALFALAGVGACSIFGEPLLTLPLLIPFVLVLSTATRSFR